MTESKGIVRWPFIRVASIVVIILLSASVAPAQKKKDKNPPVDTSPMPELPVPDAEKIDQVIGQMLGAFQVGNIEAMHKYYAENATFVRGTYDPLLVGWPNYASQYQMQRAAFQGIQLIRRNTNISAHGDVAWASYQWDFISMYAGKPFSTRGQTTLVLNKIGGNWLIVHNHTSQICDAAAPAEQRAQQQDPANPAAPAPAKP
jgi:ketosteroid isomerase-like protein